MNELVKLEDVHETAAEEIVPALENASVSMPPQVKFQKHFSNIHVSSEEAVKSLHCFKLLLVSDTVSPPFSLLFFILKHKQLVTGVQLGKYRQSRGLPY